MNGGFSPAQRRAWFGTVLFSAVGVAAWLLRVNDPLSSLPLAVFYIVLVINTYFSIRLFSRITPPHNFTQKAFDIILGLLYILLACAIGSASWFVLSASILFGLATVKYTLLQRIVHQPILFRRKIRVNWLGCLVGFLAWVGIWLGHPLIATWAWALLFVLANIFFFFISPLYRLDEEEN